MPARTGDLVPVKNQIEYWDPNRLRATDDNPNNHKPKQIRLIADSIKKFGFLNPIIVNRSGRVLAGHGRLAAALLLGLDRVPVIVVDHLSEVDERAFLIADNRLAQVGGGWDRKLLAQQLEFIMESEPDYDVEVTGFDLGTIELVLDQGDEPLETEALIPPRAGALVTKSGGLWFVGRHRLLCGDALWRPSFVRLLGQKRARLVFTDPPFNLEMTSISGRGRFKFPEFACASGEMSEGEFIRFLTDACSLMAKFSVDGAIHFVCMDWRHLFELITAGRAAFDQLMNLCVFAKPAPGLGSFYRSQHELVAVFKRGSRAHQNNIELGRHGRNRSNLWSYGETTLSKTRLQELEMHPTVKPLALVADAILDASKRDDIVLDPFGGSGTTLIAAEQTGRCACVIEIDPGYCDVILRRFRAATGIEPIREDGTTFAECEARTRDAVQEAGR